MPYLVASIITITSALIILMTRFEADDSSIMAELDRVKTIFKMIDSFTNTYIESGESLTTINFENLYDNGILPHNLEKGDAEEIQGTGISSTLIFPRTNIRWQIIPNKNDASSYKLLMNMSANRLLMEKARFSESFSGMEFCEKMLFGTLERETRTFNGTDDFVVNSGTLNDGFIVCVVYK